MRKTKILVLAMLAFALATGAVTVLTVHPQPAMAGPSPCSTGGCLIDELDLGELGFGGVAPEATGRPSYHPSVLLKLYVYGYLNRVQSSRRLEREAGRNVEVPSGL